MSRTTTAVLVLAALFAMPGASQTRRVYVLGVKIFKPASPPLGAAPQFHSVVLWGFLSAFNKGTSTGSITKLAAFGTHGPLVIPIVTTVPIAPGQGFPPTASVDFAGDGLEIVKYELSGDVVLTATLERIHGSFPDCKFSGVEPSLGSSLPQGRIPLPVFEDLFPADAVVASGDVVPFNPGPAELPPGCGNQKYVRRINLTLFNGGVESATFLVKVYKKPFGPGPVFTSTFGVPPETVQQFNSVYTPPIPPFEDEGESNLWFTITADQPFLSYVSTTFDEPQPGAIPYEVFPSKLE
jgi:hypothetical protein